MTKDQLIAFMDCIENIKAATGSMLSLCNETFDKNKISTLIIIESVAKITDENKKIVIEIITLIDEFVKKQEQKS